MVLRTIDRYKDFFHMWISLFSEHNEFLEKRQLQKFLKNSTSLQLF